MEHFDSSFGGQKKAHKNLDLFDVNFKRNISLKKVLPRSVFLSDSREEKKKNFYNQLEEWTSHIVGGTRLSEILFVRNFSKEKLERGDLGRQDYI